ncbi:MAG: NADH-quinone oxidoreductase subunit I [Chloroflexi bacterium]|nr:NADH-quinone oxidoreductase subunit I [Chloroflexota bacterium]
MLGKGTVRGMLVTLRHALETYFYRGDQTAKAKGLFTVQYPEERLPLPEHYRNTPMLLREAETDELRCTACGMCARVCPPQCIWITRGTDEAGKPQRHPASFVIDASVCMGCGFCAEFCPFDAIRMDHDYELAAERRKELVWDRKRLAKPTTYYAEINPTAWAAEQAAKAAKAKPKLTAKE